MDIMFLDDYDGQMVSGDKCGQNFLTFVLQLRENPAKNLNQEIDPTGKGTRSRCVRGTTLPPDLVPNEGNRELLNLSNNAGYSYCMYNNFFSYLNSVYIISFIAAVLTAPLKLKEY